MSKLDKLLNQAQEHLETGEQVLHVVQGTYETKRLGNDALRNGIFIATDRRLVFFGKRLGGFDMEVFPYENISSIEFKKSMLGHSITFYASGNQVSMKWINKGDVEEFVGWVKNHIGKQKTQVSTDTVKDRHSYIADLQKLAELRDAGIITEEEFQAKKSEILSRI